ncbi:hypothetical protein GGR34_003738 [Microvirga flocculans]|uniref:DUF4031 domain-containing protein n=1 Tax=Microvirga flocculans TaxID=217168 RepID=A0A7W6IIG3_9HYPH|nr:DUF4031 domain-containing protein [Microvirga flocculans]MBB4042053.1 hypothetical protein [Microvirga flocculans]
MAVYVDDVKIPYRGMIMCHMFADTREELHAMADKIGVRRKWFQCPPKARWEHYDICRTKRAAAIRHGAIATDRYGASEFLSRKKRDQKMLDRLAHVRAPKAEPLLL